ncbi:MAG: hypothetical protein JW778_07480 [Candidatus Altiarchaeota archaeon]|nr:hypothetical protein [Candidatus Altiarchaeota archaeon]
MKIEVTDDRTNPLLNRREIRFKVVHDGPTPKMLDIRKALIEELNLNKELTIVNSIKLEYGGSIIKGYAKVYEDKESMEVEQENKIKKNLKPKEEKMAEGEAKKAETKEERTEPEAAEEKPVEKVEDTEPAEEKTEPKTAEEKTGKKEKKPLEKVGDKETKPETTEEKPGKKEKKPKAAKEKPKEEKK